VETYEAVCAGTLDAVVEDEPIARRFVERDPLLELSSTIPGTDAQYAVMFRKGNDALRHAVNRALGEFRTMGTYGQIYGKWFGAGRSPSLTPPAPPDPEAVAAQ
jgi:polar amino acid transport system substrate-binding protein